MIMNYVCGKNPPLWLCQINYFKSGPLFDRWRHNYLKISLPLRPCNRLSSFQIPCPNWMQRQIPYKIIWLWLNWRKQRSPKKWFKILRKQLQREIWFVPRFMPISMSVVGYFTWPMTGSIFWTDATNQSWNCIHNSAICMWKPERWLTLLSKLLSL